jgi:TP901 family phage tail tape measure protein
MANNNTTSTVTLIINGQGAKTSLKEVGTAVNQLSKELRTMAEADDPARYKELIAQKRAVTTEYQRQKQAIGEVRSSWSKFKTEFTQIATGVIGGNLITASIQQLIQFIPNAINHTMKLKDEFANIAKTTNMTDREVRDLNKTLKTFNTRTTTSELRDLAAVGGQFGVAKEQIDEFVGAADKIGVAIGDQFGSTQEAAQQTLLLRNIFGDIKSQKIDDDLLKIGNALNVLEADGAATAPVMADLSSRIGGVLIPLKVTSAQVLGLSATLQELNVTAERGGTATVDIFQRMLTETSTFAKVANVPLKEYKDLIRNDINQAFLLYLKGIGRVKDDQIAFAKVLEESKLTGSGASEVLMKLSSNMEMLDAKTTKAGAALQNTDSIMSEFDKRNHALALGLKNLSEWWNGLIYSEGIQSFLEGTVTLLNKMLGLTDAVGEVTKKFEDQKQSVTNLTKNINPLLTEYDALKSKTSLTEVEQKRLKEIIQKVGEVLPEAVSGIDAYGRALDINTERAREAIRVQTLLMQHYNKAAISETEAEYKRTKYERERMITKRNQGQEYVINTFSGTKTRHEYSSEELRQMDAEIRDLKMKEDQLRDLRAGLRGDDTIATRRAGRNGSSSTPAPPTKPGGGTVINIAGVTDKADKGSASKKDKKQNYGYEDLQQAKDDEIKAWNDIYESVAKEKEKQKKKEEDAKKDAEELRKKELEESNAYLKDYYEKQAADLVAQEASQTITTEAYHDQKLALEQEYLSAQILVKQSYGEQVGELENQLTEKQAEQDRRRYESAAKYDELIKQSQQALQDARVDAFAQGIGALKSFVSESSGLFKALFIAEKAIAIAQVLINLQREIASYYAVAAPLGPVGMGIASTQAVAAKVRAGTSIGIIAAQSIAQLLPKKAKGGFTDMASLAVDNSGNPEGFTSGPTLYNLGARSFIGGEAGQEYVISNPMMQNPVIANIASMLEMYRKGQPLTAGTGGGSNDAMMGMLLEMMKRIDSGLNQRQNVVFNYSEFEKYRDFIDFIRKDAA